MYIVLEGVDKQGKTSLANHLSEKLGWPIVKFSKPEKDPYIEYMEFLLTNKMPAILDRFHLGEMVYGPIKRGKSGLNEWQLRNIEKVLQMRNAIQIYCFTNELVTRENFKREKEEYAQLDEIPQLIELFTDITNKSINPWWRFNYLIDSDYRGIDKLIDKWLVKTGQHINQIAMMVEPRTVGGFFSRTLVLGEVSNIELEQAQYKSVNVPFANGPSAELLYSVLPKSGVAITNAVKAHTDKSYLDLEFNLPYLERVVCLGNAAYNYFNNYRQQKPLSKNITVYKTWHPSYILRGGATREQFKKELLRMIK